MNSLAGQDPEAAREVIDSIGAPVTISDVTVDGRIRIFVVNRAAGAFYGVEPTSIEGRFLDELGLRPEGRAEIIRKWFLQTLDAGESTQFRDYAPVDTANGRRWVHTTLSPLIDPGSGLRRVMATIVDVTELKLAEEQLSELLTEALSGFIPICAACKKIRSEEDAWEPVERYISERSTARFSHTMCPSCSREWYGDLADE